MGFETVCNLFICLIHLSEIMDLQVRLKTSSDRTWRNSLSHGWMPVEKAKTFPLREFYLGLRWVRVVKRAIQNFNTELNSIYDILDIVDPRERPQPKNILVTGNFKHVLSFRRQFVHIQKKK